MKLASMFVALVLGVQVAQAAPVVVARPVVISRPAPVVSRPVVTPATRVSASRPAEAPATRSWPILMTNSIIGDDRCEKTTSGKCKE